MTSKARVVKRIGKIIEVKGWVQLRGVEGAVYMTGAQSDTTAAGQITWYPPQKD